MNTLQAPNERETIIETNRLCLKRENFHFGILAPT